ncbi:hypothetical protein THRCLA_23019 [Thraustotheca clavata]|uniref:Secreted protein n=1 Tax=Thraustotheca clavata TaxID=74557 RepID=A0A1V9YIR6_9STRA|nr:hypothetical protein THRCLA_23019 [Thraustotheca clavata]
MKNALLIQMVILLESIAMVSSNNADLANVTDLSGSTDVSVERFEYDEQWKLMHWLPDGNCNAFYIAPLGGPWSDGLYKVSRKDCSPGPCSTGECGGGVVCDTFHSDVKWCHSGTPCKGTMDGYSHIWYAYDRVNC